MLAFAVNAGQALRARQYAAPQDGVMGHMQCLQSAIHGPAYWSIQSTPLHRRTQDTPLKIKVTLLGCSITSALVRPTSDAPDVAWMLA